MSEGSQVGTEGFGSGEAELLLSSVPERLQDLVSGLDERRFAYRHGPAFPSLGETVGHLCAAGTAVDTLLRQACLDGVRELPLRASLEPAHEPDLAPGSDELLADFARVRRRTVDLLRGLEEGEWRRSLRDPQQGELTLLELCRLVTLHELGHLAQIRNLVALLPEP